VFVADATAPVDEHAVEQLDSVNRVAELVVELGLVRVERRLLRLQVDQPGPQRGEPFVRGVDTADRLGELTVERPTSGCPFSGRAAGTRV
jgi:hypothetical protein